MYEDKNILRKFGYRLSIAKHPYFGKEENTQPRHQTVILSRIY